MFCDEAKVKLGDVSLNVRRLTLAELKAAHLSFRAGYALDEGCEKLLREHVTLEDGTPLDPSQLSIPQMQTLINELVGIPEGSGISDFIGLLC